MLTANIRDGIEKNTMLGWGIVMENFNGREIYSSVENSLDDLLATLKVDLSDNQDIKSLQEKAIENISKNKQDLSDLIK